MGLPWPVARMSGQCDIPAPGEGLNYMQVAAGGTHTVLLKSDGTAAACGANESGQCDLPALTGTLTYTQVAAGGAHTVLLRSDGTAVACGYNDSGQCDVHALGGGLAITQVTAGPLHTVLLRSDGAAMACGTNCHGQCRVPSLRTQWGDWLPWQPARLRYTACASPSSERPALLLQASFDGEAVLFLTLGGEEFDRVRAAPADRLADVRTRLRAGRLSRLPGSTASAADAVLPGGGLLSQAPAEQTCADALGRAAVG
ncbi:unnamed protein product [Prorocentrum cordatum]|uniref:Uncharacterized protein n=1 Tax=Prorocentrum cordatum TaxID=2364126 RepID=A0ABN9Q2T9_9DINO|nr:unnamed protein product [Polarella glacialis]